MGEMSAAASARLGQAGWRGAWRRPLIGVAQLLRRVMTTGALASLDCNEAARLR